MEDGNVTKATVQALIAKRDQMDKDLNALHQTLKALDADMDCPLLDAEGFPKAELDLPAIKATRKSIICLTNDRKTLNEELDKALEELHQKEGGAHGEEGSSEQKPGQLPLNPFRRPTNEVFLVVENVVYGSPAYHAGLATGDEVVQVQNLHADNFVDLKQLGEVVNSCVGDNLFFTVLRKVKVHRLVARPGVWEGAGMLGARFTVVQKQQKQ